MAARAERGQLCALPRNVLWVLIRKPKACEEYEAKVRQGHLRVRLYITPAYSSLMIERAEIGVERVTGGIKVESEWADGRSRGWARA